MTKHLIINADDFGYAEGSVPATIALHEAGVVTSTTALVNQPCWPEAAAYLRDHPSLGAGVHLVMNEGRPILPLERVGSLVNTEGYFRDGTPLLLRYGRLRTAELKAEWRAQIAKFFADTGRPPDHLDLHCYYPYVFPAWFRVSLELAQEYGHLPVRMPFDDALDSKAPEMAADNGFPIWYVSRQGRRYQRLVERYGLKRPNYFEMSFSQDGHRTTEYLLGLLDALPDGVTELLAHPGTEGWREGDYYGLLNPRVRQHIGELGIALITYGGLKQSPAPGSDTSIE
ncbi:MAG: ChbG/HpnK family deacetylase [Chloroflexota bacterium]|nr:ChbG/HpnK family deacetylase [Chloroflexota bacterium]